MNQVEFVILPLANPSFDREKVDIEKIRELSSHGLEDYPDEDRAIAWLCMLGIYPDDPSKWNEKKQELKDSYWDFIKDYKLTDWHTKNFPNQVPIKNFDVEDNRLMGLIHGDLVRTGRTIFFLHPDPIDDGYVPDEFDVQMCQYAGHVRRLERILYAFSKVNAGWGYMQGFNEIITPFYYILDKAISLFNNDKIMLEALTFQCMQTILTESNLHEFYTTQDRTIIMHKLDDFNQLVKKHLKETHEIINELQIHPLMYCFKWFNLLFTQEYYLPTLIQIWDDLFSHFEILMDFAFYIGLGHLNSIKYTLRKGDYSATLEALQVTHDDVNIRDSIDFANKCFDLDHKNKKTGILNFLKKKISFS
ncbi:hypothetical protein M9Y10_001188 [Tritrichomonas musculus]|uniref:Rab-GAP TBC domain-containing protein n=1 Tax=Tritrichomonas musculus TaxID=1915356 RepID=A0ABR2L7C5_9EUKA